MSQIQITSTLTHAASKLSVQGNRSYTAGESEAAFLPIDLTTTAETIDSGGIVSVGAYAVKAISGDDILISLDNGSTWPIRCPVNQAQQIILNTDDLVETSTVQAIADVSGSLHDTYFDLYDRNGLVRVWFNESGGWPEIATVTTVADSAGSLDGTYFILADAAGTVAFWFDHGDSGTAEPSHGADRSVEITTVSNNDDADTVAGLVQAAIDADGQFSASVASNVVTVTNATNGNVTGQANGDSGFTVAVTQEGGDTPTAPSAGGGRLVQVDLTINDSANTVASAINTAFASDEELTATVSTDTVTFTDKHPGTRTDAADNDTGFTINTTQQGAAIPVVKIKSTGTTQALTGAVPR